MTGVCVFECFPQWKNECGCCWPSCVSVQQYSRGAPNRHSISTCPQHPTVTLWAPGFSEFFLFARSLACPRSPASQRSLVRLVNTVVPLLLATQENNRPCGRVHIFAMGVLYTTAQAVNEITITGVMVTQDPTAIPVTRGKKRARDLDAALRTWLKDQVTHKGFRTRYGHHGKSAVDLAPTTVHDTDEESLSF